MSKTCRFCNKMYDSENTGMLQCFRHPFMFRPQVDMKGDHPFSEFGVEHYPCCGASIRPNDALHFETKFPRGCSRIDHCNEQDYYAIKNAPYFVMEFKEAQNLYPVVCEDPLPENVFVFNDQETMPETLNLMVVGERCSRTLKTSELVKQIRQTAQTRMQNVFKDFKKRHFIDEHRAIDRELIELHIEEGGDEAHQEIQVLLQTYQELQSESFIPFCVIQRVGSALDQARVEKINGHSLCPLQYVSNRMILPPKKKIF